MRRIWALLLFIAPVFSPATQAASIDASRSQASFSIHPRLPIPSQGHFESLTGGLTPLPQQQWQVEVKVDARKLSFDGPRWLSRMAQSEAFLDAEHHPDIHFESSPFANSLLEKGGTLQGLLSLRGQQHPVIFQIKKSSCARPGFDCDLVVSGSVLRRQFGMQSYRFSIKDNVDFEFRIRLLSDPPP